MRTGSGVTLDAVVREAQRSGWDQHAVVGVPAGDAPAVADLPVERIHPLEFGTAALPFDVPGMSDVMPYPSTRFSQLDDGQWQTYRSAWRDHLQRVIDAVRPDVIHSHHVWVLSALLAEIAEDIPVVTHCHATGLRQMVLCPDRAAEVVEGVRKSAAFAVLHRDHAQRLEREIGVPAERIHVVGAGYREDVFSVERGPTGVRPRIMFAGKLSAAKGLGELCEAFERLRQRRPDVEMLIAGVGAGPETEALEAKIAALGAGVTRLGFVTPPELAAEFRRSAVCVLPSFYEGLPLVLVEAAASGCQLVATALPGVVEQLAPGLGSRLRLVALPPLEGPDRPRADAREGFVAALTDGLEAALEDALAAPTADLVPDLSMFTWTAVFGRLERVWSGLLGAG